MYLTRLLRVSRTIWASNDNLETITILSGVSCLLCNNRSSPECALIIRYAWRVWTIGRIRVYAWITLNIHIKGLATIGLVAFWSTSKSIIAGKSVKAHVIRSAQGSSQISKRWWVSVWCRGTSGHCLINLARTMRGHREAYLECWKRRKSIDGVRSRDRSGSCWLDRTVAVSFFDISISLPYSCCCGGCNWRSWDIRRSILANIEWCRH